MLAGRSVPIDRRTERPTKTLCRETTDRQTERAMYSLCFVPSLQLVCRSEEAMGEGNMMHAAPLVASWRCYTNGDTGEERRVERGDARSLVRRSVGRSGRVLPRSGKARRWRWSVGLFVRVVQCVRLQGVCTDSKQEGSTMNAAHTHISVQL
jgi:hypothetical protein